MVSRLLFSFFSSLDTKFKLASLIARHAHGESVGQSLWMLASCREFLPTICMVAVVAHALCVELTIGVGTFRS